MAVACASTLLLLPDVYLMPQLWKLAKEHIKKKVVKEQHSQVVKACRKLIRSLSWWHTLFIVLLEEFPQLTLTALYYVIVGFDVTDEVAMMSLVLSALGTLVNLIVIAQWNKIRDKFKAIMEKREQGLRRRRGALKQSFAKRRREARRKPNEQRLPRTPNNAKSRPAGEAVMANPLYEKLTFQYDDARDRYVEKKKSWLAIDDESWYADPVIFVEEDGGLPQQASTIHTEDTERHQTPQQDATLYDDIDQYGRFSDGDFTARDEFDGIGGILAKRAAQPNQGKTVKHEQAPLSNRHGASHREPSLYGDVDQHGSFVSDTDDAKSAQPKNKPPQKKKRGLKAAATTAVAADRLNSEALLGFARDFLDDEHKRRESKTKWGNHDPIEEPEKQWFEHNLFGDEDDDAAALCGPGMMKLLEQQVIELYDYIQLVRSRSSARENMNDDSRVHVH